MSYEFVAPSLPELIPWDELNGSLVIVNPVELVTGIVTKVGTADAVRANVTAVDGRHAGRDWLDSLVFPRVMQGQLRRNLGKQVLGRVAQGPAEDKKSPPWILTEATPADMQAAARFLADKAASQITAADI